MVNIRATGQLSTAGQVVKYGMDRMVVSAVSEAQTEAPRQKVCTFGSMQCGVKNAFFCEVMS